MYTHDLSGFKNRSALRTQRGAALVVSLVVLLIMTMLGVASLQTTTFEEKMVGNIRDKQLAFEAAESGLRDAETWLLTALPANPAVIATFDTDGMDGLYDDAIQEIWKAVDWENKDANNNNKALSANPIAGVPVAPRYVVQKYGETPWQAQQTYVKEASAYNSGSMSGTIHLFRVTVRGTGGSNAAAVVLQSTYAVLVN